MPLTAVTEWSDLLAKYADVIIAALVFAGIIYSRAAKKDTAEINDAVNQRHRKKPDNNGMPVPKLFDAVLESRRSVGHLQGHVLELHGEMSHLHDKIDLVAARLDAHMETDAQAQVDLSEQLERINRTMSSWPWTDRTSE